MYETILANVCLVLGGREEEWSLHDATKGAESSREATNRTDQVQPARVEIRPRRGVDVVVGAERETKKLNGTVKRESERGRSKSRSQSEKRSTRKAKKTNGGFKEFGSVRSLKTAVTAGAAAGLKPNRKRSSSPGGTLKSGTLRKSSKTASTRKIGETPSFLKTGGKKAPRSRAPNPKKLNSFFK